MVNEKSDTWHNNGNTLHFDFAPTDLSAKNQHKWDDYIVEEYARI